MEIETKLETKLLLSTDETTTDIPPPIEEADSVFQQIKFVLQYPKYRSLMPLICFYSTAGLMPAVFMSAYGAEWFSKQECDATADDDCKYDYAKWTFYNSLFLSFRGAMSFLFSGFIGSLSDAYGRKPFFYLGLIISALPFIPLCFFYNLWPYFIFNSFCGLNGSGNSFTPVMIAYVSDIIPASHRTVAFGLMYLMGGIGLFTGSLISIFVSILWSDDINFYVIVCIYFILMLYTFQCIQESLTVHSKKEISSKSKCQSCNPFVSLMHIRDHAVVFNAAIIAFMISLPETGVIDTAIPYMLDQMNAVDNKADANIITGTFIIVTGLGIVSVNLMLLPLLKKRFNDYEITIIGAMLVSMSMFMFAVISWIPHIVTVCLCGIVLSMGFIIFPSLYSIVTSSLSAKEQVFG